MKNLLDQLWMPAVPAKLKRKSGTVHKERHSGRPDTGRKTWVSGSLGGSYTPPLSGPTTPARHGD